MNNLDIYNDLPCGCMIIAPDLSIYMWNRRMTELTGWDSKEVLGQAYRILRIFSSSESGRELDLLECMRRRSVKAMKSSVYLHCRDGSKKLVFIETGLIVLEAGKCIITAISDISNEVSCHAIELKDSQEGFFGMIGHDLQMKKLFGLIRASAASDITVLITGETGTGKELAARAVHELSPRSNLPFLAVNCSALTESLLESELFGHVKGAFTGAMREKTGIFEGAKGGTVFLDEIGEISPSLQVKLLRVLQERVIQRVGDHREIKVDMRVIAATNRDLFQLTHEGRFREDLYYRLKVFTLETIPLRKRKGDLPYLCEHFIRIISKRTGKNIQTVSSQTMRILMDHCWPGNIRELENTFEHVFILCEGNVIKPADLPPELRNESMRMFQCKKMLENRSSVLPQTEERIPLTRENLFSALQSHQWNQSAAARALSVSRVTVWKRIKQWNLIQDK